ncbi:MAG TPA: hypothetical protein VH392_11840 [Sphingomicrobium sp.]|jgi:hypothetical protein
MNALWSYFWPAFGAGLAVGILAGAFAFRRRSRRNAALAIGTVAAIAFAALWHGPLGGAGRFTAAVDRNIQKTFAYYEMTGVSAQLHRGPLTRRVLLSGAADDFQRGELTRLVDEVPGVESASWTSNGGGVPLIVEGIGVAVLGFLLGLLVAYLVELRRRYNAQWNW